MLQQLLDGLAPHWHELVVISYCLIRIWRLKRQRSWQRRHSALQEQHVIDSSNETLRIVSTAFASGEPLTLGDLLSSAERDFSLRQSALASTVEVTPQPKPRESSYERLVPPPPMFPRPPPRKR